MFYDVIVQPRAERQIESTHRYLLKHAPAAADAWLESVWSAVDSLGEMPARCPRARESRRGREVRQLIVGDHRILFTIQLRHVRVLAVRHVARGPRS
ncbi:MAG TPA: type II toxin-antitoxin system RelE/ParE family toxin [Longimicrobium sp.]|nr:type II toxin-antitoxin system RelE/ParE family toxin [Longimicrobium sp.]